MSKPPWISALTNGAAAELTAEQVAGYLASNHRNAESLIAAFHATHDRALLAEAMEKFPNDPLVAYTAWFQGGPYASPEEELQSRRHWLDVLKQAAPDNAMANYLSAGNYFKSGQPALAVQEIQAGAAKANMSDYFQESLQSAQEMYEAAGYPTAQAKAIAFSNGLLPDLAELKRAGQSLIELSNNYRSSGDNASAQTALQMATDLGQRLDAPDSLTLIQPLVGIAIQKLTLQAMDPNAAFGDSGQTVQNQLNALTQHRQDIRALSQEQNLDTWLQTASEQDVANYFDRIRAFGAQNAIRWQLSRAATAAGGQ